MPLQCLFDLGGIDIEAADREHVIHAPSDMQIALIVKESDVPSAKPAIAGDDGGGLLGHAEITFADAGTGVYVAKPDLTAGSGGDWHQGIGIDHADACTGQRLAHSVQPLVDRVLACGNRGQATAFAQAPRLHDVAHAEHLNDAAHGLVCQRRPGNVPSAQTRQVSPADVLVIEQHAEHAGRPRHIGHALSLDQFQRQAGVKLLRDHGATAVVKA